MFEGPDVMIEVTRYCNMFCPHCVRGERQKMKIKNEYIDALFSQLKSIDILQVTGGEPGLAVDKLEYIEQSKIAHGLDHMGFWLATNGTVVTQRFFDVLEKFFTRTVDGEMNGIRISIDRYHNSIPWENKYKFEEFKDYLSYNNIPCSFDFHGASDDPNYLIQQGRALINYPNDHSLHCSISSDITLSCDQTLIGCLYLSVKGYIYSTCNLSYESMDDPNCEFKICHVTDDIGKELEKYFKKNKNLVEVDNNVYEPV